MVRGQTYEEMVVGAAFRTGARTVTETDLVTFVQAVGVTEPLFLDARHAAASGYSGRLVPGMMTFCFAEGLVLQTNVLHGTGMAFLHAALDLQAPVYVGDTITVVVEVLESRQASSGQRGVVTTRNHVLKQDGTVALRYEPIRLIRGAG